MAFTDQVLKPESLVSDSASTYLTLGLPWFRSLPWGGVSNITVSIDDQTFEPAQLFVQPEANGEWVQLSSLSGDDREWFVQDRKTFRIDTPTALGMHRVRANFHLIMPNLMLNPTQPISFPSTIEKELTVQ